MKKSFPLLSALWLASAVPAVAAQASDGLSDVPQDASVLHCLLLELAQLKASLLLLVLFIAVLVVSFFAYRQNRRRRAACKLERERYLKRLEESRYRESRSRLEENRKRIAGLEEELREAQASCDDLRRELIDARKVAVEKQNEQILAQRTVKQKAWQMFRLRPSVRPSCRRRDV